jgi:hypothetical protein
MATLTVGDLRARAYMPVSRSASGWRKAAVAHAEYRSRDLRQPEPYGRARISRALLARMRRIGQLTLQTGRRVRRALLRPTGSQAAACCVAAIVWCMAYP